jgi:hypothetical protein
VFVYLTYSNSARKKLLQGEYVDVEFNTTKIQGIEIPREALVDDTYVYELKDKKLIKTPIEILRKLDDTYIISGVDTTKTIVTESLASANPSVDYLAR